MNPDELPLWFLIPAAILVYGYLLVDAVARRRARQSHESTEQEQSNG